MGIVKNIDATSFPEQYIADEDVFVGIGRKVNVCFNYDKGAFIDGVVIRDDKEPPFVTIIKLSDGRVILATECQFSASHDADKSVIEQFAFKNNRKT